MAEFHLSTKIMKRAEGRSAVAAAAYRAREHFNDDRTGRSWDYSDDAEDVLFSGIYLPKGAPAWMQDREQLWNSLEKAERQKNAQVARDFIIGLPHELTTEQNRYAVQDWVRQNFTSKGLVADVNIHRAPEDGDARNVHAHVQVSMRQVEGEAFATRKERHDKISDRKDELEQWRETWEHIGNKHLKRHGFEPTLDHRSLEAQGFDRLPKIHLSNDVYAMEKAGIETSRGDELRAIHLKNFEAELEQKWQHHIELHELTPEPLVRSAVERVREEERQDEQRHAPAKTQGTRGVMAAIWQLSKIAGATLAHIVLGADRADLLFGRRLDIPKPANDEPKTPAQIRIEQEREQFFANWRAELRGEKPEEIRLGLAPRANDDVPEDKPQELATEPERRHPDMRPADRLQWAASRVIVEDARREGDTKAKAEAAAAVFSKYNEPEKPVDHAAAWAQDRHSLGRVGSLLDALRNPVMKPKEAEPVKTQETDGPREGEDLADYTRRLAKEAGKELRDLVKRPDHEKTHGKDKTLDMGER